MNKFVVVGLATFLFFSPARADPVELTIQQAANLLVGLNSLDGYQDSIKDGEREHVIVKTYMLGGGVRLAIGKDISRLTEIVAAARKADGGLQKQYPSGGPELAAEQDKLMAKVEKVDLIKLKVNELGLMPPTSNPIPPSVLSRLAPIIIDGEKVP